MSWLSTLVDNNKKILRPYATLYGGVTGNSAATPGHNIGDVAKDVQKAIAIATAATGAGAAVAPGAIPISPSTGVPSTSPAPGGTPSGAPGASSITDLLGKIPGIGGLLGKAGDFVGGNGGLNALGIAQGVNAAQLGKQSTDYANQARDLSMSNWTQRAPLRAQGLAGLTSTAQPDLSSLNVGGNPFAPKNINQPPGATPLR